MARNPANKRAAIVAFTVEVHCPHCGDPQPNPDNGAFPWTTEEVAQEAKAQAARTCVSCDEPFKLVEESSAAIYPDLGPLPEVV